jgi:hypothetical protein
MINWILSWFIPSGIALEGLKRPLEGVFEDQSNTEQPQSLKQATN